MEKENKNEDKKDKLVLSREQLNQLVKQASISSNLTLLSELSKIIAAMHKSLIAQIQPLPSTENEEK